MGRAISTADAPGNRVPRKLYPYLTQDGGYNRVLANEQLGLPPEVTTHYGTNWLGPNGETEPVTVPDEFARRRDFSRLRSDLGLTRAELREACRSDQAFIRWHLENCRACTPDFNDDLDIHDQWLTRGDGTRHKWADRRSGLRPSRRLTPFGK